MPHFKDESNRMLVDILKLEQKWEHCWAGLGTTAPFGQHQWGWRSWSSLLLSYDGPGRLWGDSAVNDSTGRRETTMQP